MTAEVTTYGGDGDDGGDDGDDGGYRHKNIFSTTEQEFNEVLKTTREISIAAAVEDCFRLNRFN